MRFSISTNFSDKIYNVVDNKGNIVEDILGKKYKTFKNMFNEYRNLIKIKNIKNTTKIVKTDSYNCIIYIKKFKGIELYSFLKKRKILSEFETRNIIKQLLIIISELEKVNVIHSDIKLENIIYNNVNGKIYLIDFENDCFTKEYMSPELFKKQNKYDIKSTLWSVGIITYLLLFGKYPFKNENSLLNDINIQKKDLDLDISDNCKNFIIKCLDKNYNNRIDLYNALNHNWLKDFKENNSIYKNIFSYLFS